MPMAPSEPIVAAPAVTTSVVAGSSAPVSVGAEVWTLVTVTAVLMVDTAELTTLVTVVVAAGVVSSAGVVSAGVVSAGVVSAADSSSPEFSQSFSEAGRTSSVGHSLVKDS